MHRALLGVLVAANLIAAGYVLVDRVGDEAAAGVPTTIGSTTTTATTSTTSSTTSTTTPPPTTTAPVPPAGTGRAAAFVGLGTWVDVFDFSPGYMQEGEPTPVVTPAGLDAMAAAGVQTLYIQASRDDERTPGILESPDVLGQFVVGAHARGMRVIAWYLPKKYDDGDLARFRAIRDFRAQGQGFDALGVDIEFRGDVPDTAERNRRLVDLSRRIRDEMGDLPVAAIVLPPVVTDIINLNFWPGFPWREIAPFYDVWMPMSYWTNRKPGSEWRDAERYTDANIAMVRQHLGDPAAPVHPIGGIGDVATAADYQGFVRAARRHGSSGWSVYDFRTTAAESWGALR